MAPRLALARRIVNLLADGDAIARRVALVRAAVEPAAAHATDLESLADTFARETYTEFTDVAMLVRVFAIVPFSALPPFERTWLGPHDERTPVLALMGTHGAEPIWNDRRLSRAHRAIPLLSQAFIEEAPMIAKLLAELGVAPFPRDDGDWQFVSRASGDGLFFVGDARTTTDHRGRLVIPASDFVERYHIRCVFGFGGRLASDVPIVAIVFCRTTLAREVVRRFVPLIDLFRYDAVASSRLFS